MTKVIHWKSDMTHSDVHGRIDKKLSLIHILASGIPTIATRSGGMVEEGTSATTLFINREYDLVNNIRRAIMELYNCLLYTSRCV